jgi:polar amino acid transport system substrate-binding protein
VVTGHPAYPPVAWSSGGSLEGAGIEVMRRLAADSGVPIEIVDEGSWDAAQHAVRDGKADAIVGLYLTHARLENFDYVQPAIAPDPSAVIVRTGESFSYKDWNSLVGKTGAAGKGEQYGPVFDAFMKSKLTVHRVAGFEGVVDDVIAGNADYGLVGYYQALTGAPKGKIAIADPNFVTEGLYVAFGKTSPCSSLAPAFSKDIAQMIADGTIKRLFAAALAAYTTPSHR